MNKEYCTNRAIELLSDKCQTQLLRYIGNKHGFTNDEIERVRRRKSKRQTEFIKHIVEYLMEETK